VESVQTEEPGWAQRDHDDDRTSHHDEHRTRIGARLPALKASWLRHLRAANLSPKTIRGYA
jgi:hypothetical protein